MHWEERRPEGHVCEGGREATMHRQLREGGKEATMHREPCEGGKEATMHWEESL